MALILPSSTPLARARRALRGLAVASWAGSGGTGVGLLANGYRAQVAVLLGWAALVLACTLAAVVVSVVPDAEMIAARAYLIAEADMSEGGDVRQIRRPAP